MDNKTTKKCKHCQTDIPLGAKKCPNCQSDLRNWFSRHPILTFLGIIIILPIIFSTISGPSKKTSPATSTTPQVIEKTQETVFDIPTIFGKTFQELKATIGKPTREGAPGIFSGLDDPYGFAEWDKEGFTLSIRYDDSGRVVDPGKKDNPCGMSLYFSGSNQGENVLRQAGNLTKSDYPFTIIKNTDEKTNAFYGLDICQLQKKVH